MAISINKLYNYFFASIYTWYIKHGEKDIPGLFALCVISLLQSMNIFFITYLIIGFTNSERQIIDKRWGYALFFMIFFFNYFYIYKFKGKEKVLKEFTLIASERKLMNIYSTIVFVYAAFSLVLFCVTLFLL